MRSVLRSKLCTILYQKICDICKATAKVPSKSLKEKDHQQSDLDGSHFGDQIIDYELTARFKNLAIEDK